ncbi:hypothetical protein EST38_g8478 [Candolleomyces aberdarensis]|uniref:Uncharacterized protein n=1 Tax=Candolleomyces aberdarensis TaxID=2316362 RepID=A0A4Q2DE73_9AGAR|nr:hypothetical protein EST38_g8478 [Candolleomyces aberdarensis]
MDALAPLSLYDMSRHFNLPPPSSSRGNADDERANSQWLLEATTVSPGILNLEKAALPNLARYHTEKLPERINALKHLTCVYGSTSGCEGYWFIANTDRFVKVPTRPCTVQYAKNQPEELQALDYRSPQWLDNTMPWIGFSSTFGANEGLLLSTVRIPNSSLPRAVVETSDGTFSLDPNLVEEWSKLEEGLVALWSAATKYLTHLPDMRQPKRPRHYGYQQSHTSRTLATDSIRRSRNAFSRMITFLSFVLSFWRFANLQYPFANLLEYLQHKNIELWKFATELTHTSNIADFRKGTRTGYLIDLFNYPGEWYPFLHIWAEAGVPLWIYAGLQPKRDAENHLGPNSAITNAIRSWIPTTLRLSAAFGEYCARLLAHPLPPKAFRVVRVGDAQGFIPELASLGIRDVDYEPGMPPGVYFASKKETLERWKANNEVNDPTIPQASESWMVEEWRPLLSHVPMYVWECERRFWARRQVAPAAREAYFHAHHPKQRYWCPISRSVELCSWLYEEGGVVDLAVSFDSFEPSGPSLLPPPCDPAQSTGRMDCGTPALASQSRLLPTRPPSPPFQLDHDHPVPNVSSFQNPRTKSGNEEDGYSGSDAGTPPASASPNASTSVSFNPGRFRSWKSTLTARLGYDLTRTLPPYHLASQSFPPATRESNYWERAARILGLQVCDVERCSDEAKASLADAAATLLANQQDESFTIPDRWDIASSRPNGPICPPNMAVHSAIYSSRNGPHRYRAVLALKGQKLQDQWWVLVVSHTALLQLCRSGIETMMGMGRYLIQHGIPFHTAIAIKLSKLPSPPLIIRQLGQLPSSKSFGAAAHSAYEVRREAFLKSRRGGLALKAGGILWRLAIEFVDRKRVKDALAAPGRSAETHGYWCGAHDPSAYGSDGAFDFVDEHLDGNELDILLGAYRVPAGGCETIVFLWPTEKAWANSAMNIGAWSADCEAWFQKRLSEIRAGTAELLSSNKWKEAIRFNSAAGKVWSTYESLAQSYIIPA